MLGKILKNEFLNETKEKFLQYVNSGEETHEESKECANDFSPYPGTGKRRILHRPFGKFKRKLIFGLIFIVNVLINIDHGAIPAATTILKRDLDMDNVSLGIIGSLVYLGLVLGALSASVIFQSYTSKWVVSLSIMLSCLFLYMFTVSKTVFFLAISRIGCGFFQVFFFSFYFIIKILNIKFY